jgi:salt tolerance NST1 family regulator
MANAAKGPSKANAPSAISPSSNVASTPVPPGQPSVNRKKQKRRQKAAAKLAATQNPPTSVNSSNPSAVPASLSDRRKPAQSKSNSGHPPEDDNLDDSDDDDSYDVVPSTNINGHFPDAGLGANGTKKKSKKKKKNRAASPTDQHSNYSQSNLPSSGHTAQVPFGDSRGRIWNTSSQEEQQRIKDFWNSLSESERKSLVKIEKDAVIKTMKDQQKHSCSCSVCGRKRNAIEEELEVLYDAYYNELEQYDFFHSRLNYAGLEALAEKNLSQLKNRSHLDGMPPIGQNLPPSRPQMPLPDEYDDDDYDDEDELNEDSDGDYSFDLVDEPESMQQVASDLFQFGNSLTVKGLFISSLPAVYREWS